MGCYEYIMSNTQYSQGAVCDDIIFLVHVYALLLLFQSHCPIASWVIMFNVVVVTVLVLCMAYCYSVTRPTVIVFV